MGDARAWLIGELHERLLYYRTMTSLGPLVSENERPLASEGEVIARPESMPELPLQAGVALPGLLPTVIPETLDDVRRDLGDCTRCRLHGARRSIVFGAGSPDADLMFVGEGPGHEEDVQGVPFVGAAGQLLTKIIQAVGMTREQVYIANIVKCRPPGNREPEDDEVASCLPFLLRQIRSVGPRVICTLGRVAVQSLLATGQPLTRIRGRTFSFEGAVLVPTYHPAFLLRNPSKKRETWEDMKLVMRLLRGER